jgi:hypothetical protein
MRQPAIFAITVGRGVPQSNFSRRKITLRYAASAAIIVTIPYSGALSRLRCPFVSCRYFFITVRLLKLRASQYALQPARTNLTVPS